MSIVAYESRGDPTPWTVENLGPTLLHWQSYETLDALSLGAVASWDGSAGTPDLVQGTGAAQPTLVDVGGLKTVEFDGTDDFMDYAGGGARYAGAALSVGVAFYLEAGSPNPTLRLGVQAHATDNSWFIQAIDLASGNSIQVTDDGTEFGGLVGHQQAVAADVWHHDVWVYDGSRAAEIDRAGFWKNGKEWPTPKVSFPTFPPLIRSSAANLRIGDADGHPTRFDRLRVRSLVIDKAVWTPNQVRRVSKYLQDSTTVP